MGKFSPKAKVAKNMQTLPSYWGEIYVIKLPCLLLILKRTCPHGNLKEHVHWAWQIRQSGEAEQGDNRPLPLKWKVRPLQIA